MTHTEATEKISQNYLGIIDTTLREGEQFAGQSFLSDDGNRDFLAHEFSVADAQKILSYLARIGVERAEVPNPIARGIDTYIRELVDFPERPPLVAHIRNHPRDMEAALQSGVEGVHILTTVDEDRLNHMGLSLENSLHRLTEIVGAAQKAGVETRVSVEHSWDNATPRILEVYQAAAHLGVDRIGLADTVGRATHWEVAEKIRDVRFHIPYIPIEVHLHNDYLSAATSSLEALAAGANWIDTTLGGFGERTGIVPLSVFLCRLATFSSESVNRYNLQYLSEAEHFVSEVFHTPLPHNIVTAANAFTHRAGIHIDGIRKLGASLYEPFQPGVVGNQRALVLNTRISGKTTLEEAQQFYQEQGRY